MGCLIRDKFKMFIYSFLTTSYFAYFAYSYKCSAGYGTTLNTFTMLLLTQKQQ